MAYTCVFAPSHECDGCDQCRQDEEWRPDPRWDCEYDNDEEYCRYCDSLDEEGGN